MNKKDLKLLLLDDSEEFAFLIKSLFEIHNIQVDTESYPSKAVLRINEEKYDLILTDYMMDEMDGITFAKKVIESKVNSDSKIILLTAKDLENDELQEISKLGIIYLNKPIQPDILHKKILDTVKKDA